MQYRKCEKKLIFNLVPDVDDVNKNMYFCHGLDLGEGIHFTNQPCQILHQRLAQILSSLSEKHI